MSNQNDDGYSDDSSDVNGVNPLKPGNWNRYTRYHFLLAKFLLFGGAAAIVFWLLGRVSGVLFPVIVSLIIAYLFDPLIDWLGERGIGRTVGIAFVLLVGIVGVGLFALVLYPTIVDQVRKVGEQLPKLIDLLQNETIPWVEETFSYELPGTVSEGVENYGESFGEYAPWVANQIGAWVGGIATGTGAVVVGLINLIMIPIFSFFFLRDFDRMRLKLVEFIPEHYRRTVRDRAAKMDRVVGGWVRGQLQVAGILALMYAIGLSIAFQMAGVKMTSGISIGILAGLLNFIPYVGTAVGMILSFLIVLINWSGIGPVIAVGLVFVIAQSLEGWLITPKIVGEQVGLNPVTVIIVLLVGGEVYGLIGFIVAVPLFGALKVLFPDIIRYYKDTAFFRGRHLVPEPGDQSDLGRAMASGGASEDQTTEETDGKESDGDTEETNDEKDENGGDSGKTDDEG